jgi:carbamoyltransferase
LQKVRFSDFGKAIAATAQKFFEENSLYALRALEKVAQSFGGQAQNLCMTGGAALNCPANTRIFKETQFENIFIPPSCDDGGLSIGAAMYGYHQVLQKPRAPQPDLSENIALNGRQFGAAEIKETVVKNKSVLEISDCQNFASGVCKEIADGKVVAVMTGRSEIGPRALGNRSILADPRKADNWRRVNQIKDREHWRPFAPACLKERLADYFDGGPSDSPHMLFNYNVKSTTIPAVTHVDKSARVQTVNKSKTSMRALLEEFYRQHDIPVLLNTSFNGRGEPIVERPDDAIEILKKGKIDAVFISNMKITLRR